MPRISHYEFMFITFTGGPSGLVLNHDVFHNSNPLCSHTTGPLRLFHSHSSQLLLGGVKSPPPPFFFSFRCNKPSGLRSSIVCIYFIHVLF
uniref:Uncharacterized protein n=2 Tax=Canis lupus TaxID=9612 RepID=A0A8C0N1I8_CANLF